MLHVINAHFFTLTFPVPSAVISSVPLNTSVYSGTVASIFCAFKIRSEVDTPVMVKTLWIGPQGPVINGSRTTITTSQSGMAYNTTLHIKPLNISDTGLYRCVGSISSSSSYVVASSNASANISLSVQGEDKYETSPLILTPYLSPPALPPPVVTTTSYGNSIAGSVYSLVCTVKVVEGLVVVPDVVWMKDGIDVVNGTNTTLTRTVSVGNITLNLMFNPLLTSHGGQCN